MGEREEVWIWAAGSGGERWQSCEGEHELPGPHCRFTPRRLSSAPAFVVCWASSSMVSSSSIPSISTSDMPVCVRSWRSLLFSSTTFLAAACISADASTPVCSQTRYRDSSSDRYSFRRARDRRWLSRMRARLADLCMMTPTIVSDLSTM